MNFGKQEIFRSGDRFRGYVVERLLGNGSLGAVYLVRHEVLDTVYALKALFPEVAKENEDYVKRFLREAKIATRIRHPNLVAVHDCGYDEARGLYYIVWTTFRAGTSGRRLRSRGVSPPTAPWKSSSRSRQRLTLHRNTMSSIATSNPRT